VPQRSGSRGMSERAYRFLSNPSITPALLTSNGTARVSRVLPFNRFYGHQARTIADWCGVSLSSARAYKSGKRHPPRPVLRLWSMYTDRRVLGDEWESWLINGNALVDPDGNSTTLHQLQAYWVIMQIAADQARRLGPAEQDRFYEALRLGDRS
jgi:hypothetical protein